MGDKYELYENGILVESSDTRTVSGTFALRTQMVNDWMSEQLAPTDYVIIKAADPTSGTPVPPEIQQTRADIRAAGAAAKAKIAAAATAAKNDDDKAACDAIEAVRWS